MIRKFYFVFLLVLCVMIMAACGTKNASGDKAVTDNQDVNDLIENIGVKQADVFDNLGLKEGEDVELFQDQEMSGLYLVNEERTFHDETFQYVLTFDIDTDKLYGFWYIKNFEEGGHEGKENAYDLTQTLNDDFNDAFGEPSTSPGIEDRIDNMPNLDGLWSGETFKYYETWVTDDELEVQLSIEDFDDIGDQVKIIYGLTELPDDWEN